MQPLWLTKRVSRCTRHPLSINKTKEVAARYTQLTREERYTIKALKKLHYRNNLIAKVLGRHPSTIGRELKRNKGKVHYFPGLADDLARGRRRMPRAKRKIQGGTEAYVKDKIMRKWSPEQIPNRILLESPEGVEPVSHECVYQYLRDDRAKGGALYKHLRRGGRKYRRRWLRQSPIPNRVSIEERPASVAGKERVGDWEGDLIVGKRHQSAMLTLVERKTKYTLVMKLAANKNPKALSLALIKRMENFKNIFHTLTLDNGFEFAAHEMISGALGVQIYFAHPHSPWERGLNENTNGLLRQFFRKGVELSNIPVEEVLRAQNLLNGRPRKTLGYKTPYEMLVNEGVALVI